MCCTLQHLLFHSLKPMETNALQQESSTETASDFNGIPTAFCFHQLCCKFLTCSPQISNVFPINF